METNINTSNLTPEQILEQILICKLNEPSNHLKIQKLQQLLDNSNVI